MRTVRDAAFDVLRRQGMTTLFGNPGSTEVPLLTGLPDDLRFVLALHEGSVVGAATGWALARGEPALALLHTTAGLGNAVGALATARENRAPLVALVGQQDRRHLVQEPFLTGRLAGLAGDYPVRRETPPRAQDVPGALARAAHAARLERGPALVLVPMDDWAAPAEELPLPAPDRLRPALAADPEAVRDVADLLADATAPALVVGAGCDAPDTWGALTALVERLRCPVWQEAFGARAGFPQHHPSFAGHLPSDRSLLREVLAPYDLVLSVGAPVLRQYAYRPGPLAPPGTRLALVTDDPAEAVRAPVEYAALAPLPQFCAALAAQVPQRAPHSAPDAADRAGARAAPGDAWKPDGDGALEAAEVLAALAARIPADAVVLEETPSSRPELHALLPARRPSGFLSAAMGGLGFALPAAVGVRMGAPARPVVAVAGDGSALYQVQALWTAAHYGVGVLVVVLANGRYAVLDQLAGQHGGGGGAWPAFPEVSLAGLATALGCPARRVTGRAALLRELDEALPKLAERTAPLLLEVEVSQAR
ncbi:thiamine pyrophosphate-dependent enzyme [Streptomyces boncukensis]|uniref:Thiamine pyrophosphate-binding protein n=1 Tax=Streptomyces boncukensis TaxID=2711219 RepID=A0A6G4X120_9ACTN|nr:thiamine pyrophosphate-dependent enzyme [Streptomyces boncukensis]NGO70361.1 thiamine pyrophosphate-binding protein [Streptomyces boncukensis]